MPIIITGSEGNIGRKLRTIFPDAIGIDVAPTAQIVADLATIDYAAPAVADAFRTADGLVHLATSPQPDAPDAVHFSAVTNAARLLGACERYDIRRLVLASSDWAAPKALMAGINTYGHSKRVFEAMAAMYAHTGRRAVALRFGWVPRDPAAVIGAPQWLLDNYWDDDRLFSEVTAALGPA